MDTQKYITRID